MKKFVTLVAILGLSSVLAACSSSNQNKAETIEGSYVLISANDQTLPQSIPPVIDLSVSDDLTEVQIKGKMCNLFNGNANYQNGVLQGNFMMTRALCNEPELNALDMQVSQMFAKGVKVQKSDDKLILTSGTDTLVYQQKALPMTQKDNTK
ncbi:META domain-containing protein [Orbus mooreae]|uniref:META domain-containing protein n=1 Tax=Orbus mooreae TaxID=3074107 RepID=UPI00370D4A3D